MPLASMADMNFIRERLGSLSYHVKLSNSSGMYDIDHAMEDFCTGLFNLSFDLELKNLNLESNNMPAIDLGDDKKRIAIQVTAEEKGSKVSYTYNKFVANRLYKKYDRLIIFMLCDKQGRYTQPTINESDFEFDAKKEISESDFNFNVNKDILNFEDFIHKVEGMEPDRIASIKRYISKRYPYAISDEQQSQYDRWMSILSGIDNKDEEQIKLEAQVLLTEDLLEKFNGLCDLKKELDEHRSYRRCIEENVLSGITQEDPEEAEKLQYIENMCMMHDDYSAYDKEMSSYSAYVNVPYLEARWANYGDETDSINKIEVDIKKRREELKNDITIFMRNNVVG